MVAPMEMAACSFCCVAWPLLALHASGCLRLLVLQRRQLWCELLAQLFGLGIALLAYRQCQPRTEVALGFAGT